VSFIYIDNVRKFIPLGKRAWLKVRDGTIYVNTHCRAIIGGDLWRIEKSMYSMAIDFENNILLLERVEENGFLFTTGNRIKIEGLDKFLYGLGYCVGTEHPYKYIGRKEFGWMFRMPRRKRLKRKWRKKKRKSGINMKFERMKEDL